MEEDLTGEVDFDFFESPGKTKSFTKTPSPNPIVSNLKSKPSSSTTQSEIPVTRTQTNSASTEFTNQEAEDIAVAKFGDTKRPVSSPVPESSARRSSSGSLSESDYSKEYSDSFSDVSSVDSKKSRSSRSRSSSASVSRSRSSSRESYSHSGNSSTSHQINSPKKRSNFKLHNGDAKATVSFLEQDGQKEMPEQKVSQKLGQNVLQRPRTAYRKSRKPGQTTQKQAWDTMPETSDHTDYVKEKTRKSKVPQYSESSDASSRSGSSSDSDMTDVSPLTSPRNSPSKKKLEVHVQYKQLPLNDNEGFEGREVIRNEDIDLSILMKALCDHEKEKRVMANRRVMFAPSKNADRHNFTFSNDRATLIDRENQRLLNQLMRNVNPKSKERHSCGRCVCSPAQRLTSSAVNRKREQRRIEMENMVRLIHTYNIYIFF